MTVGVSAVRGARDRRRFVDLAWAVHRDDRTWVPPLRRDEQRFLDPATNAALRYCLATLALAWRDGAPCGRVMGIVNPRANQASGRDDARFGLLECGHDPEVAQALLGHVEAWACAQGMRRVVGPMGFTDQDPEGLLVEGFEHDPAIASYWNAPWMAELVEGAGYQKELDYVVYRLRITPAVVERYAAIERRLAGRGGFRLVEFRTRRELAAAVLPILRLMAETFRDAYGFVAPDEPEMRVLARQWLPVLDPRFVKAVAQGSGLVGFIVGMPCLAEGLRAANGRLLPLGLLRIRSAARRSRRLDLLVGGVLERCRRRGVDALLGRAILREGLAAGLEWLDSHHEQEDNRDMRDLMERVGGEVYKRYRIYRKRLDA